MAAQRTPRDDWSDRQRTVSAIKDRSILCRCGHALASHSVEGSVCYEDDTYEMVSTCPCTGFAASAGRKRIRVTPMFAWFDLWVGVFIDRPKKRVYVFPLPCIGFVIERVS